jgi:hypothetical protein
VQLPVQSFNETRTVDVTVLTSTDRVTENLKLKGLDLRMATSALVGARIYDTNIKALIATSNVSVAGGSNDVTVTIPIHSKLVSFKRYRIGFYVKTDPPGKASATLFEPDPFSSPTYSIPYVEDTGVFCINSANSVGSDSFPANSNRYTPQMTISTRLR